MTEHNPYLGNSLAELIKIRNQKWDDFDDAGLVHVLAAIQATVDDATLERISDALGHLAAPSGKKWVPHIVSEGSRTHVVSWSTKGPRCSEPRCEINQAAVEAMEGSGD
jgi:hypothetical protein